MNQFGVIFDWDGVVVDSSERHEEAWVRLAAEEGHTLPEGFFLQTFGMINEVIIPETLCWTDEPSEIRRISLRKEELYRVLVREQGLDPLPGVADWFRTLLDADVPITIGSSTQRANIELSLEMMGLRRCFQDFITSENVTRGKPDPEVFVLAAQLLDREPEHCVVFEDTVVGINAAVAAGTRVIGVSGTHPPDRLSDSDLVISGMTEMNLSVLKDVFA